MGFQPSSQPRYLDGADWINAIPIKTQLFYPFRRSDNDTRWQDSAINPGTLSFNQAGDKTLEYTIGDLIFVSDYDDPHVYNEISVVTTAPIFAASWTTFDVDMVYVTFQVAGVCNNLTTHTNYRAEIQIWNGADTLQLIDETFEFVPKQNGVLKIDLSDIGMFLLRKDDIQSLEIIVRTRKIWNQDTTDSWLSLVKIQMIAADVTKEESSTAMLDWTPDDDTKKWLTRFEPKSNMKLTRGWKHYIYFIVDEDFNGRNGGDPQLKEFSDNINRAFPQLIAGAYAISPLVAVFEYTIVNNNQPEAHMLLQLEEDFASTDVLEEFWIRNTDESEQPIMLHWLNELGGKDQWLFNMNQQVTETITEGVKTLAFSWDKHDEKPERSISRLNSVLNQKIDITAKNLSANQFDVLRYLIRSDDIQVYLKKDASKKTGVLIVPDTMTWETKEKLFDLTLTIEFAPDFDFFKEKEY